LWSLNVPLSLEFCEWQHQYDIKPALYEDYEWTANYQLNQCAAYFGYEDQNEIILLDYCQIQFEQAENTEELYDDRFSI